MARQPDESLLLTDEAVDRLGSRDPLKVQLLGMRAFGGMTAEESASVLSIYLCTWSAFGLWESGGASVTGIAEPELPRVVSVMASWMLWA